MANFKITNVTNTAGKRELGYNSVLDINYVDSMMKKTIKVKPGEVVFLQIHTLPLSVHKLRVRKLINVIEVSDNEMRNSMNANKPVVSKPAEVKVAIEIPDEPEEEKVVATTEKKKKTKTTDN